MSSFSFTFPLAIDNTLAGEHSNSYVDLDGADGYFAQNPSSVKQAAWNALSDDQKTLLLINACADIESYSYTRDDYPVRPNLMYNQKTHAYSYGFDRSVPSCRFNPYQRLQFPRNKDVFADGGVFYPLEILIAQCEQAIYSASFDDALLSAQIQGVEHDQLSVGNVHIRQIYNGRGTLMAPLALHKLKPFMINRSRRIGRA